MTIPWRALATTALGLALLSSACQVVAPQPPPEPRLLIDRSALSTPAAKPAGVDLTYTVKRGTIRESLVIPGQVVPARAAQLSFSNSGTITTVHVRSGQAVKQGDALVELALTEEALKTARTQALLAEIAYESQQAKVRDLEEGAGTGTIEEARADVARAQAALRQAELAREAVAKAPADSEVTLAQLAVEQARDDLAQAREAARSGQQDVQVDAATAQAAVRAAERRVSEASIKLEQTQAAPDVAEAGRAVNTQHARLEQARDDLADAEAAVELAKRTFGDDERSQRETEAAVAAAEAAVRTARRQVTTQSITLEQLEANQAAAQAAHAVQVQLAQLGLDQAKDDLALAQAAAQRASAGRVDASGNQEPTDLSSLQAAVRAAERQVKIESIKLEAARARQADRQTQLELADLDVATMQAELAAAQAKLAALEQGASADAIQREEKRADLLRDEVDAARRAAQPIVILTAPFAGTVTGVAVSVGQAVDDRTMVVHLSGEAGLSVVANASEFEVAQLPTDRPIEVAFPGLGNEVAAGAIVDVSGVATTKEEGGSISYPFRVDLDMVPPGLKIGMTASVTINLREARDTLYVPTGALRQANGQTLVTRIDPSGEVADVPVQVGGTYGADVEIVSGLEEGDVVAVYSAAAEPTQP